MWSMGFKTRNQTVVLQTWTESESGWGCRPDGWSLHLSLDDCKKFIAAHDRRQHEYFLSTGLKEGQVPAEYTRADDGNTLVTVSSRVYRKMVKRSNYYGINGNGNNPPHVSSGAVLPDESVL